MAAVTAALPRQLKQRSDGRSRCRYHRYRGESTRPGAAPVAAGEELKRILPVIEACAADPEMLISVDTSKAVVAREALAAGAAMINDVSAFAWDPALAEVVADTGVPVVLMHLRGTPETMQQYTRYDDLLGEIGASCTTVSTTHCDAGLNTSRLSSIRGSASRNRSSRTTSRFSGISRN